MLSSFTSFLPSRLQGAASKDLPRQTVIPDEQSDDEGDRPEPPPLSQPENKPVKSKDRDGKGPSEVSFSCICSGFSQAGCGFFKMWFSAYLVLNILGISDSLLSARCPLSVSARQFIRPRCLAQPWCTVVLVTPRYS